MKTVGLPDEVWGRLATVAEDRDTTVEDLLVAAVTEVTRPRGREERIIALIRSGYTDAHTAEATYELKQYVGEVRRRAGLPANKQRRAG